MVQTKTMNLRYKRLIVPLTYLGMFLVTAVGVAQAGGIMEVFRVSKRGDRLNFFNMDPDLTKRTTFLTALLSSFISKCTFC